MRAAQCGIALRLRYSSADICTANIRNNPEFAAVAIHLLKGLFVASGSWDGSWAFNMHRHFIYLFILASCVSDSRRVSLDRGTLGRNSQFQRSFLSLRISRGVSADCGALECWGKKSFAAHSSQANSCYQPGLINSTKPLERLFIRASQTITEVNLL